MGNWFRFFGGTPRRFLTTLAGIGLIVVLINPGILETAVNRFAAALMPLLGPALAIVIVFAGLRMILRGK
ncbi:MAG: hypothetical protein UV48_C0029G0011 [Candidatus Azambacteria bacterium GW2011_GWA2_42_9]|uniref:Uncharacterized protein n=1 Tax=Candidatus Azambacteria bacterium GW2011_GWA2_42_9 TaxID=1618613 RepID=A0A0G1BN53_9BACT|nr:MAG: hypothetical protein UV48_C0029G0011 [Candidatus Azambacteria bacterium GW2011_GWA2_42_9]